MKDTSREALETFVERVHILEAMPFMRSVFESGHSVIITLDDDGMSVGREGPETHPGDQEIAAFVNTFRLFVQQRDDFSLFRLEKDIVNGDSMVSQKWKNEFLRINQEIEEFLADNLPFQIDDHPMSSFPTHKEIMEVFLYGNLAHTTQRARFNQWKSHPEDFAILQNAFIGIIVNVSLCLRELANVTELELRKNA